MKELKRNWLIIPLLIIGFYYNFWTIENADEEMVFEGIIYGFLVLLFLIFLGIAFRKDLKKYKIDKSVFDFVPTIAGMFILLSFIAVNVFLKMRDSSPVVIQAGYDGGYNGAWFEFRKDGTYKFVNNGGIGATISRGRYELKDSIIYLDKRNLEGAISTNKLAIRNVTQNNNSDNGLIYQIDDNHNVVDKYIFFRIYQYDFR